LYILATFLEKVAQKARASEKFRQFCAPGVGKILNSPAPCEGRGQTAKFSPRPALKLFLNFSMLATDDFLVKRKRSWVKRN
jgi:hypothetical protein